MQATTSNLLISFEGSNLSKQQKQYTEQVYGSIRLKLQNMAKYQIVDKFIFCQQCRMALTQQDKQFIYHWDEINNNKMIFKPDLLKKIQNDPDRYVIWSCRFCNNKNTVIKSELKFAKNNCRFINKPAQKQIKKDPIILIVFDRSGSMQQCIKNPDQLKKYIQQKGNKSIKNLLERLRGTNIYKKIITQQQKSIQTILKKQKQKQGGLVQKNKYQDYLTKNKLLMSLTQLAIQKNNSNNDFNGAKYTKTIGFMFFNSAIYLQLSNKKVITVYDSQQSLQVDDKEKSNFYQFQNLYKIGQKYGEKFTTSLSNFKFQNLDLSNNTSQGQTALGPAIAIALGIISKHGPGSSIVVVTDGIANKGIFEQTLKWDQQYKLLKMRLQKIKGYLVILEWKNSIQIKKGQNKYKYMNLNAFCNQNSGKIAQKIQIPFNENSNEDLITNVKGKIQASINRNNVAWTNQILIHCQNPNISYQKSMNQHKNKTIDAQKVYHLQPIIKQQNITQKDYIYPFMTQTIVKYQDTRTNQQSTFMSYILQKFVKYQKMKKKDKKILENQITLKSVATYLYAEDLHCVIQNLQLSIIKKTFRNTFHQKTMKFPTYNNQNYNHNTQDNKNISQQNQKKQQQKNQQKKQQQIKQLKQTKIKKQKPKKLDIYQFRIQLSKKFQKQQETQPIDQFIFL